MLQIVFDMDFYTVLPCDAKMRNSKKLGDYLTVNLDYIVKVK